MMGLCAVLCVAAAAAQPTSSSDRLRVEIDAEGQQPTPEMAAKEWEARAGMAKEMSDALTDIMAVLLHGSDSAKDSFIERLGQMAVSSGEAGREQAAAVGP